MNENNAKITMIGGFFYRAIFDYDVIKYMQIRLKFGLLFSSFNAWKS